MRLPETRTAARRIALFEHLALAVGAFVPQLLARPGVIEADTKTYLYVDPARYLRQSASMWDPTVGLGTVTHQQIGYLFPMGPFFWATHALGVPTWVAQRLWAGALLFAAGAGAWHLCRLLGVAGPGRFSASAAYMLSPYPLQYLGHISVIVLAFAALPWFVVLVDRAAGGSWRAAAAVALVVAAMGSVNATSAIYVAVGPVLWLAYSWVTGRHGRGAVWRAVWRCGSASALVSLWWVAGLAVEGGYGIDVLRYTETVQAVSTTSLSSEVVRGLGYWYFYGGDNFGPWVSAMPQYTQQLWLLGVSAVVPVLGVAGAVLTRFRHRVFLVIMVVVGVALAVGAHPFASPSPVSRLLRALLSSGTVGLALRSTDRATPLVVLGLAALAGALVTAVWRRAPGPGLVMAGVAVGAAVAANPALWNGTGVPATFTETAPFPYELSAAQALDSRRGGAVLGLPGQPFASTFASTTVDPLWPGLLSRPFVTREQQVLGSLPTVDLLYGLDDPIQRGVADTRSIEALSRLMGVGDVLLQDNLAFTRYDQPDPAVLWSEVLTQPAGLGAPVGFGRPRRALDRSKVVDEQSYTLPTNLPPVPSLAVLPVTGARPLVRAEAATRPVVVDGDGVGVDDVANTGLLAGNPTLLYAGNLDGAGAARRASLGPGATLVVTDSNRRQAFRWDQILDEADATLPAGAPYPADPSDHPLNIFPTAPADAQTTAVVTGIASVTASSYGNPFQYLPEDRPVGAVDGDPDTAWQVGPFLDPRGQWWQVRLRSPVTAGAVTLVQPQVGPHDQWITAVTLHFDGRSPQRVALGSASRGPSGQVVHFPTRTFRILRVTIDATNLSPTKALAGGVSAVGLAEVELAGVRAKEQVVMPSDLLRTAGSASTRERLVVEMSRLRVAPGTSRTDPESALDRVFWQPEARTFTLTGTARLDPTVPDELIDALVGRTSGPGGADVVADSSGRLQGDVADTASAALDGDGSTLWSTPLGDGEQIGQSITVRLAAPVTVDQLHLQVVVDGRHSVPSALRVTGDTGSVVVSIPKLPRQDRPDGVDPVTVHFPALSGRTLRVTVLSIRPLRAVDYYAGGDVTLPVALAELGIPGVQVAAPPPSVPGRCRDDLLRIDGQPVWIAVTGLSSTALSGGGLAVSTCGPDAAGVPLGAGTHAVVATPGRLSGIDLDQLVLDSAPGGGPERGDGPDGVVPAPTPPAPPVHVLSRTATTIRARVDLSASTGTSGPVWLVLGESLNSGWQATVQGGPTLGAPRLVDGFANGWLLPRSDLGSGSTATVVLRWTPQSAVNAALVVSAVAGVLCLGVAVWPRRRRRVRATEDEAVGPELMAPFGAGDASHVPSAPPSWGRVAAASVGAGVVASAVIVPVAGVGMALAVAGACLARRGRLAVAVSAIAGLVAAAVIMVIGEGVSDYPGNGQWPSHFEAAAVLTWVALSLVVAESLVRAARRRRARPRAPAASPSPSPPS